MVATIDKWKHLTMEDIRKLEEENRKELEESSLRRLLWRIEYSLN